MSRAAKRSALFVDTAGWMAMADAADTQHRASCAARDRTLGAGGMLVTTDYVLDETLTLVRLRLGLEAAARLWSRVEASQRVRHEWIDPARAAQARHWFFRWRDKDFSFTDCTSFVVMQELHLARALTTDRHFRQAGFEIVPGSKR